MKLSKKRGREMVKNISVNIENNERMKSLVKNSKYYIKTYGCQMNEHDTEVICGILNELGYKQTETPIDADLIIFNTCAIRENAEK